MRQHHVLLKLFIVAFAGPISLLGQKPVLIDLPWSAADVSLETQQRFISSEPHYFAWRAMMRLLNGRDWRPSYYPYFAFYGHYYFEGDEEALRAWAFTAVSEVHPYGYAKWLDTANKDTAELMAASPDSAGAVVACPSSLSKHGTLRVVEGGGGPHDSDDLSFTMVSADFGAPLAPLDIEGFQSEKMAQEKDEVRQAGAGLGSKWRLHVAADPGSVFHGCRPYRLVDEDEDMPGYEEELPQAVLVDRGNCSFHQKASFAAAAGATAMLVVNSPPVPGEEDIDEDARLMPMGAAPDGSSSNLSGLLAAMVTSATAETLRRLEATRTTPRPLVVRLTQHDIGFLREQFVETWPRLIEIERQITELTYGWRDNATKREDSKEAGEDGMILRIEALTEAVHDNHLREIFGRYGAVVDASVERDRGTGLSKVT